MKINNIFKMAIGILIPLITGMISAALTRSGTAQYAFMDKPPLSPPAFVFPVAWTILYIMMGISSYFIYLSISSDKRSLALLLYAIQLAMNFMWSIIFFNWRMYLFAFLWLVIMLGFVLAYAFKCCEINKIACYLLIPYIVWLIFAAYLNFGTFMINRV